MATVTAIYRPFLVAVHNTVIGTHWGVRLYECLTKPMLQKNIPTCTQTVRLIGRIWYVDGGVIDRGTRPRKLPPPPPRDIFTG